MEGPMDVHDTKTQRDEDTATSATRGRVLPAALLVAALIGFLLPFGTASCGTPVTFTGFELATASVPAQGSDEREMADMIESNGTLVAAIALVSIAVGLVLLALRVRGWGVAAAASLLALLLLPWLAFFAELDIHSGYLLSVGSLVAVMCVRRVASIERRLAEGRCAWPAVLAGAVLAIPLVLTVIYVQRRGA